MIQSVEIAGRIITPYLITALIGIFTAGIFGCKISRKRGIDGVDMLIFMLIVCVGIFFGGALLYGIVAVVNNFAAVQSAFANAETFGEYLAILSAIFGGSVFYGGLLGGISAGLIFIKAKRLNTGAYTDVMALVAPLFHTIARMGCFLSGCCYGMEWEHGMVYHHSLVETANNVPRFPVQLVESVFVFLLFLVLLKLFNKNRFNDRLFCIYLMVYAAGRFFLEFLRGDEIRGVYGFGGFGVSTSQIISVILFVAAAVIFIRAGKKSKNAK